MSEIWVKFQDYADKQYQTSNKMSGNVIYPADFDQLDIGME